MATSPAADPTTAAPVERVAIRTLDVSDGPPLTSTRPPRHADPRETAHVRGGERLVMPSTSGVAV